MIRAAQSLRSLIATCLEKLDVNIYADLQMAIQILVKNGTILLITNTKRIKGKYMSFTKTQIRGL